MKRFAYLVALVTSFALVTGANAAIGSTRPDDRARTDRAQSRSSSRATSFVPTTGQPHGPRRSRRSRSRPTSFVPTTGQPTGRRDRIAVTPEQVPVIAPGGSGPVHVDGFDWLDAGIGAAAALGLGLIVGRRGARASPYPFTQRLAVAFPGWDGRHAMNTTQRALATLIA